MTTPETNATWTAAAVSDPAAGPPFADRLVEFIQSEVATDDAVIDGSTDLLLTGLVDSLGVVMIVDWIEHELGVAIDAADVVLEHFQTVDLMLRFLHRT